MRYWSLVVVASLLLGIGLGVFAKDYPLSQESTLLTIHPRVTNEPLSNPYIGMAPPALNGPYQQPHRLVYMVVTWRELEPEKGKYAFKAMEQKYKLNQWFEQGVRTIIRVVLDYSNDEMHKDIPDWLYEEINHDGTWYDEEVGKGFSPNYDHAVLIDLHDKMIAALGERYNADPRVAFVALGSLGHWGEWHTYSNDSMSIPFPKLATSDQYVEHYVQAFPDKKLLMRRPHPIAKEKGIGLYNDMFGSPRGTLDYVDWFENGYYSNLAGGVDLPAMPDFWKHAPSGGEFANASIVRSYVQNDQVASVLQMLERSHVSWLGPSNHADLELNEAEQMNLNKLLIRMGYRLRISAASFLETAVQSKEANITLHIMNEFLAPFYYDWPLELTLLDEEADVVARQTTKGVVQQWLPGESVVELSLGIPLSLAEGSYQLHIAILDPESMKPGVQLAMEGRQEDGRYSLGTIRIREMTRVEKVQAWFSRLIDLD